MHRFTTFTAVALTAIAGTLAATEAVAQTSTMKAGPRNTVQIQRTVRERPIAQFAALSIEQAQGAGKKAEEPHAKQSRRYGPRGTLRR